MSYSINLFPSARSSLSSRIWSFVASYLRYILVFTQFVVIVIFFYRYTIDSELNEEREKLQQKKAIIQATAPLRKSLDNTQAKIAIVKGILNQQSHTLDLVDYIFSIFPKGVTLEKLTLNKDAVTISCISLDFSTAQKFYNRLGSDRKFAKVEMKDFKKVKDGYSFDLVLAGFK